MQTLELFKLVKRLTGNQGNSNYWEEGNKMKEPDSRCSFKVSTYLKISFGLVSRHPHLLTSQRFGSFISQWRKEKYISVMRQLHAGVAVIVGTGLKEWGQRQPRQACLAGLCSERAHSFMEYLCNCKADYLLSQSPSLPADRRAAWYSSLVSHQVQIQFVWHESIQMPEDCWQFSFSGNKTATSTPAACPCQAVQSLFQGRVPSLQSTA